MAAFFIRVHKVTGSIVRSVYGRRWSGPCVGLLLAHSLVGQSVQQWGLDSTLGVQPLVLDARSTPSGGTLMTYSSPTGMKLAQLAPDGSTLWSNHFGSWPATHQDRLVLADGRVAMLALEGSNDQGILKQFDFRLLSIEPDGSISADHRMRLNVLWDDVLLYVDHLVLTKGPNGQLVALVEVWNNNARHLVVASLSIDGVVSWARWYGDTELTGETPFWTEINDRCQVTCSDEAIYVAFVNLSGGFHVMKLSENGDLQWCNRYEYENVVIGRKLTGLHIAPDGSVVCAGGLYTQVGFHGLLLRLDADGSLNAPRFLLSNGEYNNEIKHSSMAGDGTMVCRIGLPSANRFVHVSAQGEVASTFRAVQVITGNNEFLLEPKLLEWDGSQLFIGADLKRTHQVFGYVDLYGSFWRLPVPPAEGCALEGSECAAVLIPDTLFSITSLPPDHIEQAAIETSTTLTPVQGFSPAGITDQCEALSTGMASLGRTADQLVIGPALVAAGDPVRVEAPWPCRVVVMDAQGRSILRASGAPSRVTALTAPSASGSYWVMALDSSGHPLGIGRLMVH